MIVSLMCQFIGSFIIIENDMLRKKWLLNRTASGTISYCSVRLIYNSYNLDNDNDSNKNITV